MLLYKTIFLHAFTVLYIYTIKESKKFESKKKTKGSKIQNYTFKTIFVLVLLTVLFFRFSIYHLFKNEK
jgi:hypothetical protein